MVSRYLESKGAQKRKHIDEFFVIEIRMAGNIGKYAEEKRRL